MSKNNKIIIIFAIILIIALVVIIIINKSKDNNVNNKVATAKETTETTNKVTTKKSNGVYEIYNTDIKTNTGSTKLTAVIKNISGNKTERKRVEIVLLDKNNNEIGTITVTIPKLDINETTEILAEDVKVYENIYDFKIK